MGLRFAPDVQDYVRTLAPDPKKRIREALEAIRKDPRPPGFDVKLLRKEGAYRFYRVRLGDYRIIYAPRPDHTYVWRIQHRSDGYDWLERLDPQAQVEAPGARDISRGSFSRRSPVV